MATEIAGYVGLSRLTALRRQMDVTTNNIANMNTAGFKGERVIFNEHLERVSAPGPGREEQSYVIDKGTFTDLAQGGFETTGNPLDVALHGDGWLSYMSDEGVVYGRDGRFVIDDLGRLSTVDGKPVLDVNGAEIVLPLDEGADVAIAGDGTISVDGMAIGALGLFTFDSPQRLERMGNGVLRAPEDEMPLPAMETSVVQGAIENSNVQPVVEMTRMMELHRAYESVTRLSENAGELQRKAINQLGRSS